MLALAVILSGFAMRANAQNDAMKVMVDSVDINEVIDLKYIQLLGVKENGNLIMEVDYGAKLPATRRRIVDADGTPQRFNSMVDALNFMDTNGWEFLNAFEVKSVEGKVYHFLLRRKEEINMRDFTKN